MQRWIVSSCLAAAASTMCVTAYAAPAAPAAPAAKAEAADKNQGSDWLRCDGAPRHESGGELLGRLVAITATAGVVGGLVGGPEMPNVSKRADGTAGASACEAAIRGEHDEFRQSQLTFALAIHDIEAKDYPSALKAAQAVPVAEASNQEFQRGLGVSLHELQAAALVRLDRPADAEAEGLKMTEPLPWDLASQIRASRYLDLTSGQSPAKAAYYDHVARIYPYALPWKAGYQEQGGDFAGAAKTMAAAQDLYEAFRVSSNVVPPVAFMARRSIDLMLAGDMAESDKVADQARAGVDGMIKNGSALNNQALISQTDELLEFQGIGRQFAEGHATEARAAFAAKAHWLSTPPFEVAALSERLRKDAPSSELTGQLSVDPAKLRADGFTARIGALIESPNADAELYKATRPLMSDSFFSESARMVWRTDKSPYLKARTPKDDGKFNGEFIYLSNPSWGPPASEALMLHLALVARSRGKAGFVLSPARSRINAALVLFGSPGDPGLPEPAFNYADKVIADISRDIPDPAH